MLTILKVGGNIINDQQQLAEALDYFSSLPGASILVHGGGRKASEVISAMGMTPAMINGRRITDEPTLEVVTMVYAGLINKRIVGMLQQRGTNALGLSGADGNAILAHKRPVGAVDYGFAGDVDTVNAELLSGLLSLGIRPVLCPITHDGRGQLLNTNADTIANETATALAQSGKQVSLQYCFELPGVMRDIKDPTSVIKQLTPASYQVLKQEGVIQGGMIPKLDNAFRAVAEGVKEVVIGDLVALASGAGTRCVNE